MQNPAHWPEGHPAVPHGKIGVMLVNLGTPDATDYWSMRRYLAEFLWDKRVIEVPRVIWWFILNLIILTFRPGKSGKNYASIWDKTHNDSPLRVVALSQAEKLRTMLADLPNVHVEVGMRYGNPSITSAMDTLKAAGCERILSVPLYPQYAAATTATANDALFAYLMKQRWQPTLRIVPPYHDSPTYIAAIGESIKAHLATLPYTPEVILASFHGIPKKYFDKGDPYHCHCHKTARLVREYLGYDKKFFRLTFQSRFGAAEWLQPYTDKTVEALATAGVKNLAVVTPGFSVDCVETLEEIVGENGEIFHKHGGENFTLIPCLNDSTHGMQVIEGLVRNELKGWV